MLLGMLCLVIYLLLPSLANSKPTKRGECAANLRAIAIACIIYAESHQGQFPSRLSLLTDGGARAYLRPQQLKCPVSGGPYVYISGQNNTIDPRNVVAYEPVHYHSGEGGNMSFTDGHVSWHKTDGHAEELRVTQERLHEYRLSQEAGTRSGVATQSAETAPGEPSAQALTPNGQ
jgi:prepilin-type processing-associated H-X9-DG protein